MRTLLNELIKILYITTALVAVFPTALFVHIHLQFYSSSVAKLILLVSIFIFTAALINLGMHLLEHRNLIIRLTSPLVLLGILLFFHFWLTTFFNVLIDFYKMVELFNVVGVYAPSIDMEKATYGLALVLLFSSLLVVLVNTDKNRA